MESVLISTNYTSTQKCTPVFVEYISQEITYRRFGGADVMC